MKPGKLTTIPSYDTVNVKGLIFGGFSRFFSFMPFLTTGN